ncbi:MAG: hypothetical protein GX163_10610 [Bacteroidetes bacterium]|jgi:acetyltransferase-like isoleucine patch superfamily enzyme|nr:hypothetical protein [Bacteroidota bacterium]
MNENFIAENAKLISSIHGLGVKIYRNAELRESILGNDVQVGDDSILLKCKLESNIAINRRNFIQESQIGRFTYTGFNTVIRGVEIGRFCSISWNVSIGGKNHDIEHVTTSAIWGFYNMLGEKLTDFQYNKGKGICQIGNDVLISSGAIILRNVKIGNGAVIGAGAVVTKDVEPYSIVAGVPAKKIKMRFDDKTIEALEEIQWWNWPIEVIRENLDLIYSTKVDKSVIEKLKEIAHTNNL